MEIGFNEGTAAWIGAGLSVILGIIQLVMWIYKSKKRLSVSVDYDFMNDRLSKIIVTSVYEKPLVIDGIDFYIAPKKKSKNRKNIDIGQIDTFIYKRLNHFDSYTINISEEFNLRRKKEEKVFIEIYLLDNTDPKILQIM